MGNQWMKYPANSAVRILQSQKFNYRLMSYETDSLANWQAGKNACNYFGEEVITEAENKLGKQIRQLRGIIAKGKKHPAYASMKPIAREVIKAYQGRF